LNANLLQRSEVVALINTLHRFSESLHAVEVFRRLWRESTTEQSAKLIREAENVVNTPVCYYGYEFTLIVDIVVAIPAIPTCQYKRLISC
jgi:Endoplasmic Reticulum Oxidoreductin 1 (ERO1)